MSGQNDSGMLYDKMNYVLIISGVVAVLLGFVLMSGGGSESLDDFHPEEIFSDRRITVAPFVVLLGFAIVGWGVMRKPSGSSQEVADASNATTHSGKAAKK